MSIKKKVNYPLKIYGNITEFGKEFNLSYNEVRQNMLSLVEISERLEYFNGYALTKLLSQSEVPVFFHRHPETRRFRYYVYTKDPVVVKIIKDRQHKLLGDKEPEKEPEKELEAVSTCGCDCKKEIIEIMKSCMSDFVEKLDNMLINDPNWRGDVVPTAEKEEFPTYQLHRM